MPWTPIRTTLPPLFAGELPPAPEPMRFNIDDDVRMALHDLAADVGVKADLIVNTVLRDALRKARDRNPNPPTPAIAQ